MLPLQVYRICAEPRSLSFHAPVVGEVSIKVTGAKSPEAGIPSVIAAKQTWALAGLPGMRTWDGRDLNASHTRHVGDAADTVLFCGVCREVQLLLLS